MSLLYDDLQFISQSLSVYLERFNSVLHENLLIVRNEIDNSLKEKNVTEKTLEIWGNTLSKVCNDFQRQQLDIHHLCAIIRHIDKLIEYAPEQEEVTV